MGYIKHDTIVCTSWDIKYLTPAHEKAAELFGGEMVSEIVNGRVNGQVSFFIAPDGSKAGWQDSNECNELRQEFLAYLKRENSFVDYCAIHFGGDDDITRVYTGQYEERD